MTDQEKFCEQVQLELADRETGEVLCSDSQNHLEECRECQTVAEILGCNAQMLTAMSEEPVTAPANPLPLAPAASYGWRIAAAVAAALIGGAVFWPADSSTELRQVASVSIPVPEPEVEARATVSPVGEEGMESTVEAPVHVAILPPIPPMEFSGASKGQADEAAPRQATAALPIPTGLEHALERDVASPAMEAVAGPQEATLVKVLTSDPDVVIYWLVDTEPSTKQDPSSNAL